MGNPSNKDNFYISEIEFKRGSPNAAFFSCKLPDDSVLSIIIQNELGQVQFEKQILVDAGEQVVELDLTSCGSGKYHAWIDLFGQTFIRNIIIENRSNNSISWLKKVKNLFST